MNTTTPEPATLTTREVCELARIDRKTLARWIAERYLPAPINGRDRHSWRFSAAKVRACLEGRKV
jgi:excisionase family DNA binding protein